MPRADLPNAEAVIRGLLGRAREGLGVAVTGPIPQGVLDAAAERLGQTDDTPEARGNRRIIENIAYEQRLAMNYAGRMYNDREAVPPGDVPTRAGYRADRRDRFEYLVRIEQRMGGKQVAAHMLRTITSDTALTARQLEDAALTGVGPANANVSVEGYETRWVAGARVDATVITAQRY